MKKIIVISFIALFPLSSFAAVSSPARVSVTTRMSAPIRVSTPVKSYAPISRNTPTPRTASTNLSSNIYNNSMVMWIPLWIMLYNQNINQDNSTTSIHFPYILILDKETKQYELHRYIGPNNQNELVSSQEADNLEWLKEEIK